MIAAPMEARCKHCRDTGSLSQWADDMLDCHYCDAANQRIALRNHLTQFTGWPQNDVAAWAAYLFAQRQAAPVAAQPVEESEPVAWIVFAEMHGVMVPQHPAYAVKSQAERCAGLYGQTSVEVRPLYAAPQPAAQQSDDVARDALALAYGIMWHVNAGMDAPAECGVLSVAPERAAYEARKVLRDMLTQEQRGHGIHAARKKFTAMAQEKV